METSSERICVIGLVQVSGLFEGAGSAEVLWYAQSWNTPRGKIRENILYNYTH